MSVVTIGKFDGFHMGHRLLLSRLQEKSGVYGRAVVLRILTPGKKLLCSEEEIRVLSMYGSPEMKTLEFTPEFMGRSPESFVKDILVNEYGVREVIVGKDFHFGKDRAGNVDTLTGLGQKYGFSVTAVDKLLMDGEVVSSSRIRNRLAEGDISSASKLLGQDISYSGVVKHGKQLGRTIGFPTINLIPDENKLLPCFGVYRSVVEMEGAVYDGLTNIGLRPTVDESADATIETFIRGFDGDAYDRKVSVRLVDFIRPEQHFGSVDELREQLKKDLEKACNIAEKGI